MARPSVKGLQLTPSQITNRNDFGNIYPDQQQVLYGNKVADLLSFLPDDIAQQYDEYVKRQPVGTPGLDKQTDAQGNEAQRLNKRKGRPSLESNPNATSRDFYQDYQSQLRAERIKIEQRLRESGLPEDEVQKQVRLLTKNEGNRVLRDATFGQPTMDEENAEQFIEAASKNSNYMLQLRAAMDELMRLYGNRLQFGQRYYSSQSGQASLTPIYNAVKKSVGGITRSGTPLVHNTQGIRESLQAISIILFQLVTIGAIRPDDTLKVRPINIRTGQFQVNQAEFEYNRNARRLGIPQKGVFVVNDRISNVDNLYRTFSGVDITATYALGYKVGRLPGLNTFTWSIHRGKPDAPRGDEVPAIHRARGRRTIAGTMVFTIYDEHPITAIYPRNLITPEDTDSNMDKPIRDAFTKPDQIPAFDIIIMLTNEYGYASIMTLLGVEIMDDGGSISMNDLINEEVISYTAKDIDLLHPIKYDKNGHIDPFELGSLQSEMLYDRRNQVGLGEEGSSYYSDHDKYYSNYYTSPSAVGSPTFTGQTKSN